MSSPTAAFAVSEGTGADDGTYGDHYQVYTSASTMREAPQPPPAPYYLSPLYTAHYPYGGHASAAYPDVFPPVAVPPPPQSPGCPSRNAPEDYNNSTVDSRPTVFGFNQSSGNYNHHHPHTQHHHLPQSGGESFFRRRGLLQPSFSDLSASSAGEASSSPLVEFGRRLSTAAAPAASLGDQLASARPDKRKCSVIGGIPGVGGSNKKERRRTQSINNAFSSLRDCIPNVPCDTKLSKIKTLRLATSYIDYLMTLLNSENPEVFVDGFKAEIHKKWNEKSEDQKRRELVCKC